MILGLVLLFILHDFCFEELIFKDIKLLCFPKGWEVTSLSDLKVRIPKTLFFLRKLIGDEEDQSEIFCISVLVKYILMSLDYVCYVGLHNFILIDNDLIRYV